MTPYVESLSELVGKIVAACSDAGFQQSDLMFSARTDSDALRHKSFQVLPTAIAFEATGAENKLDCLFEIRVAYRTESRQLSTFQHEIADDTESLVRYLQHIPDVAGGVPINATFEATEDDRFIVMSIAVPFDPCVQRA